MRQFAILRRNRLLKRASLVAPAFLCVASIALAGCHKTDGADAQPNNQALLQQQISDTEHDSTMSPEAKARYIQFLKDKLGGSATPAAKSP